MGAAITATATGSRRARPRRVVQTANRIDELAGQIDRLARVCEDLGERRLVVLEIRSQRAEALAAEFAGELASLRETLRAESVAMAGEVERLAERVDAIDAPGS